MPLPHPPGYRKGRQHRVDRRRIVLSAALATLAASLLLVLVHRVTGTPGESLRPISLLKALILVSGAGGCAAWGETMRQLALTQLGEPEGPEEI